MDEGNGNVADSGSSSSLSAKDIEKAEEEKLKAKYKLTSGYPMSGHSVFLQKKLAKGQKFFDSGDYQMAKQQTCGGAAAPPNKMNCAALGNKDGVASAIPPNKLLGFAAGTGGEIPKPDTVPVRKTSIIQSKYTSSSSSTSTTTSASATSSS